MENKRIWKSEAASETFKDLVRIANEAITAVHGELDYMESIEVKESYQRMIANAYRTAMEVEANALASSAAVMSVMRNQ